MSAGSPNRRNGASTNPRYVAAKMAERECRLGCSMVAVPHGRPAVTHSHALHAREHVAVPVPPRPL